MPANFPDQGRLENKQKVSKLDERSVTRINTSIMCNFNLVKRPSPHRAVNTLPVSAMKTNQLMSYRKIIAICSAIHTEHTHYVGWMQNFSVFNLVANKVTAGFQRVNRYTPIQLYISLPLFLLSSFIPAFWPTKPYSHGRIFATPYRTVPDVLHWWILFGMKSLGRHIWHYLTFISNENDSYVRRRRHTQVRINRKAVPQNLHQSSWRCHFIACSLEYRRYTVHCVKERYCKTVRAKHRGIIWSVTIQLWGNACTTSVLLGG